MNITTLLLRVTSLFLLICCVVTMLAVQPVQADDTSAPINSETSSDQDQPPATQPVGLDAIRVLFHQDFNEKKLDRTGRAIVKHKFIKLSKSSGPDESHAIRVTYKGFERGSERVVMRHPLKRPVMEASLTFDVFFEEGFQFIKGGKLHGLGPKKPITGGGVMKPDGWSARSMFKQDGRISAYSYQQNKKSKWGIGNTTENPVFTPGQWHTVTIHVKLNSTPDKADGFAHYYVDGVRVVMHEEALFRGEKGKHTLIQQFLFSTFHGGNKPMWAPVDEDGNFIDVYARFDNFLVVEGLFVKPAAGPVAIIEQ